MWPFWGTAGLYSRSWSLIRHPDWFNENKGDTMKFHNKSTSTSQPACKSYMSLDDSEVVAFSNSSPCFYDAVNLLWFLPNHRMNGSECNSTLWGRTMPGAQQLASPAVWLRIGSGRPGTAARLGSLSAFCCTMQEQPELSYANACHCV